MQSGRVREERGADENSAAMQPFEPAQTKPREIAHVP
jgi:hypothetical protein